MRRKSFKRLKEGQNFVERSALEIERGGGMGEVARRDAIDYLDLPPAIL